MTLHPTPTRVALLQAVADGAVTELYQVGEGARSHWDRGPGEVPRYRDVTARAREAVRAGWTQVVGPGDEDYGWRAPRPVEITDAGRAVLDEAAQS